ncbi:hypothetical protein D3C86_1901910 [compost metagenome]
MNQQQGAVAKGECLVGWDGGGFDQHSFLASSALQGDGADAVAVAGQGVADETVDQDDVAGVGCREALLLQLQHVAA